MDNFSVVYCLVCLLQLVKTAPEHSAICPKLPSEATQNRGWG